MKASANMAIDAGDQPRFSADPGLILTFAVLFIALNLAVDLLVRLLDRGCVMVDLTVSDPIEGPSRWLTSLARGGPRLWWGRLRWSASSS